MSNDPTGSFVKVEGAPADEAAKAAAAAKAASDAAAAAAAGKAARPEGLSDDLWDAEKNAVKFDVINTRLKEANDLKAAVEAEKATAAAAKAADDAKKATLPKKAEDYKPDLPKGLPEGMKIDVNDERFKAAQKLAFESGLSQEAFTNLLGIEAQRAIAADKLVRDAVTARDAALGPNGAARVDAVVAFQKTIAPDDKVAGELARMLVTPGIIETFERIQQALGSQGVDALKRPGSSDAPKPGEVSDEEYARMSFAQRMLLGTQRKAASR